MLFIEAKINYLYSITFASFITYITKLILLSLFSMLYL